MGETLLFCFVFLSQILMVSWLLPRQVIKRGRYVLANFPPSTHPKLYPQSPVDYERWLRNIARLDLAIVVAGLVVIALLLGSLVAGWDGWIFAASQKRHWDTRIVTPFFLVQFVGLVGYINLSSRKFLQAMAKAPPPRVRTTELHRRRLVDFVSPTMLVVAALTNVVFIAFILYCWRFQSHWMTDFKAATNIGIIAVMLVAFSVTVAIALRAPKFDPYQAHQDRLEAMRLVVRQALTVAIAYPVLITIIVTINLFDSRLLEPVIASLFVQGCALALLWPSYTYRADKIDFNVYRQDDQGPTGVT
jgi:hypothetical protein